MHVLSKTWHDILGEVSLFSSIVISTSCHHLVQILILLWGRNYKLSWCPVCNLQFFLKKIKLIHLNWHRMNWTWDLEDDHTPRSQDNTYLFFLSGDTLTTIRRHTPLLPLHTNVTRGHMALTTPPNTLFYMGWNY